MSPDAVAIFLLIAIGLFVFLLPVIIAFRRRHPNRWVIMALNVVLGGTGIVWVGSLIWALNAFDVSDEPNAPYEEQSGAKIIANNSVPSFPATSTEDALQQIERLKELYIANALTEAEFKEMKRAIILRM